MKYIGILLSALLLAGCGPQSSYGFRLPDGNADAGQTAFADLKCNVCHRVAGSETASTDDQSVVLGGAVDRVQTYGELVTAIINPSHKIAADDIDPALLIDGKSAMETARLNHVMTVQQLVDVVAYLQPQYKVPVPQYNPYTRVYP